MEYVCALIVPDFDHLKRFAKEKGIEFKDESELIQNEQVRKLIKDEIDAVNKTMADFERVKRHDLLSKPFSIESGELTPSMKVKRKVVKEKYAAQIEGLKR